MNDYDNRGQVSLWKPESDNPKAPAYKGTVVAHRDIREGEEFEIALWANPSDNPKAPKVKGKISDKFQAGNNERQPERKQPEPVVSQDAGDDFNDEIPF